MADYNNNRGGGYGGGNKQERKLPKSPIDWAKIALSAPCPTAQGQWSSMTWDLVGQNIRTTVWTNDPEDKENDGGKISSSLSLPGFFGFLTLLDQAIKSPKAFKRAVVGLNWFGFGGKRQDTPRVDYEMFVCKDDLGIMSITLTKPKRPNIVFNFDPKSPNYEYRDAQGNPLSEAERSLVHARAFHSMMTNIVQMDMLSQLLKIAEPSKYEPPAEPKWKQNNGGGGNSYGNRSNGSNYGNSNNNSGGNSGGTGYNGGGQSSGNRSQVSQAENEMEDEIPY